MDIFVLFCIIIVWKKAKAYHYSISYIATGLEGQFSFQSQRRVMPKNVQTTAQLHSSLTPAKQCWKFSKQGFNSTWTVNFQLFRMDLEKAEEPEIKLPTSAGSLKKQENSRKTSAFALSHQSLWLCRSQQTVENSSREGNTRPPYLPPEKSVRRSRSKS